MGEFSQNDAQDDVIRSSHASHHAFASGKSHALDLRGGNKQQKELIFAWSESDTIIDSL